MQNFIGSRALPDIVYHSPGSMEEVMQLLQNNKSRQDKDCFKIVAGSTDFIPAVRTGRWRFSSGINIIDISKVKTLAYIKKENNMLKVGPCTTLTQLLESKEIIENAPMLAQAVSQMASLQIRNTATIGGNICMSSPAGDTIPPLLVLGATVTIKGADKEEQIPLKNFFTGPGENILKGDQILAQISFPVMDRKSRGHFLKIGSRTAVTISIVSAAVSMELNNDRCENPKIALGSVAPTPLRIKKAEDFLENSRMDDQTIEKCAAIVSEEIQPITDLRGSQEYRKDIAATLVKRALTECREEQK